MMDVQQQRSRQQGQRRNKRSSFIIAILIIVCLPFVVTTCQYACRCIVIINQHNSSHRARNPQLNAYEVAYEESLGYFSDIPEHEWELMRNITLRRVNNAVPAAPLQQSRHAPTWYQTNWDPDFSCRYDTKVGHGDGGKWVCDPTRLIEQSRSRKRMYATQNVSKPACLIYSIGSQGKFEFEEGMIDLIGNDTCEIHTFDFSNYAHRVPNAYNIHFHPWGLKPSYTETKRTSRDGFGQVLSGGVFKTLDQTMDELGHTGLPIDLFKIDCEGCEWSTYKDWLWQDLRQILVEVHSVPPIANDFFQDLQRAGYVTYHKEPNIQWGGGTCVEYAFLKLARSYVEERLGSSRPLEANSMEEEGNQIGVHAL